MKTPFELDLEKQIRVNEGYMSIAAWNLILSIRDVKLYRAGLKPHRYWKITTVKNYFGVKGSPEKVLEQLERIHEHLVGISK